MGNKISLSENWDPSRDGDSNNSDSDRVRDSINTEIKRKSFGGYNEDCDSPGIDIESAIEMKNIVIVDMGNASFVKRCVGKDKKGINHPDKGICYIEKLQINSVKIWAVESDVEVGVLADYLGKISALIVTFDFGKLESFSRGIKLIESVGNSDKTDLPIILAGISRRESSTINNGTREEVEEFVKKRRNISFFELSEEEESFTKCLDFIYNSIDVF